jgi:Flp pilus assembly protein TadB
MSCTCHYQAPELCKVHQKTVAEMFDESSKAFKAGEDKKKKKKALEWFLAALVVLLAGVGLLVVALVPAWLTLWSANKVGLTAFDINLGTVIATAWLMSIAVYVLYLIRGSR